MYSCIAMLKSLKYLIFGGFVFFATNLIAQKEKMGAFNFNAFAESYISFDFNKSNETEKPNFIYNHKKLNALSANLVFGKINYTSNNLRGNLALMVGDYASNNLKAEPKWAQYILEANVGVKLSKKENIWLDLGVMPSHIGFESAISADCWTLTRSMVAENSPYYETGAKLSFVSKNEKLTMALLALNGWQKIATPSALKKPSYGMQVTLKATDKLSFNYSNFIGTDRVDNVFPTRSYHNFYLIYDNPNQYGLIIGIDLGTDKKNVIDYGNWITPVIIYKKYVNSNVNLACRAEYYNDKHQIIVPTNTINGFKNLGISTNVDIKINKYFQWRLEVKRFSAKDAIFSNASKSNTNFTTNLTFKL
jgi:hypothetical protein